MALLGVVAATLACRAPGLPAEPPGHDAAEAEAEIPAYEPSRDPLTTSAFVGVELGKGGHAHHGSHGARKHAGHANTTEDEPPREATTTTDHAEESR